MVQVVDKERLAAVADDVVSPWAKELGMDWRGDLVWVAPDGPIRRYLAVNAGKAIAQLCWGVSLDFVPHLQGGSGVAWHRTCKSARMDLGEYALAGRGAWLLLLPRRDEIDLLHGRDGARRTLTCALARRKQSIAAWYAGATTLDDLVRIAGEHHSNLGNAGLLPAPSMVLAFVHAERGDAAAAEQWLGRFLSEHREQVGRVQESELRRRLARP